MEYEQSAPFTTDGETSLRRPITAGLDLSAGPAEDEQVRKKLPNGGGLTEAIHELDGFIPGTTGLGALVLDQDNVRPPLLDR